MTPNPIPGEPGPYRVELRDDHYYHVVGPTPWTMRYGWEVSAQARAEALNAAYATALAAAPGPVSADMEEMKRALVTICEQAAGVAGVSGLAGVPSKAIDAGRALLSRLNSTESV